MTDKFNTGWKKGDPIGYIRDEIPEFEVPSYDGEWYEVMVPDTLDLQERAALAVNGTTEPTDPEADYEIYWWVNLKSKPANMRHDWSDQVQCKFMEGLPLLRIASGSDQNGHVERAWMDSLLHQLGLDGLAYMPLRGRPWGSTRVVDGIGESDQVIIPFYNGRLVSVLTLFAMRDPRGPWKDALPKLVDALIDIAVQDGRYAYYWPGMGRAERVRPADAEMPTNMMSCEIRSVPLGMIHAYRYTGYEPALEFAGKVNTYLREQYFDADGGYLHNLERGKDFVHFHMHTAALYAMLEEAHLTGDSDLMDFVVKGYEYGVRRGEPLSGYFPEFLDTERYMTSEICEVADMIALAIKLSQTGVRDCWDDADRWLRNMFAEGQLVHTDWVARMPGTEYADPYSSSGSRSEFDRSAYTTEKVAERNVGAFAGWPAMNDWYVGHGPGIMHCCTGNAIRTLYQAWESILEYDEGRLRVNLLLNRASPWADVDSYIPFEGQVDIRVKTPLTLSVRIPEWVNPGEVQCSVESEPRGVAFDGRYALVGEVEAGSTVALQFPIFERTDEVHVQSRRYHLVRKGNEIVVIDPPGRYAPFYQRSHYRASSVRWRKMRRFVSDEQVYWRWIGAGGMLRRVDAGSSSAFPPAVRVSEGVSGCAQA